MKKTAQEPKVTENSLYHDTWMLLRKYRDVVWSLELSVQQVRRQFQIEYGSKVVHQKKGLSGMCLDEGDHPCAQGYDPRLQRGWRRRV